MLNLDLIPSDVMDNLLNRKLSEEQIANLTPTEALNEYLAWEGIQGYTDSIVEVLDGLRDAEIKEERSLIRLCPSEDGTFFATKWNPATEEYEQISPVQAVQELAMDGTHVQIAANDLHDKYAHWECVSSEMERV